MAISNFIPGIWKENLFTQLDKNYVGVKHCTREYEGNIDGKGSVVNIPSLVPVNIFSYVKGYDMGAPQKAFFPDSYQLKIDQAKAFNFIIDDIERVQSNISFMDEMLKNAAKGLAKAADKYVYGIFKDEDVNENYGMENIRAYDVTVENVIDYFYEAINILYKNDVTNADEISIEVSPDIAMLIVKAKMALGIKDNEILETGCIGRINGCKIFVSNNIYTYEDDDERKVHRCFVRTNRAIAFAEQLSEMTAYRPEKRFGDAVKGLHLYGAKVARPNEMVMVDMILPQQDEPEYDEA